MDDEILLLDGDEAVAAIVAQTLREARIVRFEFQLRPIEADDLGQFVQRQHAVEYEHLFRQDVELSRDKRAQLIGGQAVEFEPDHRSETAALQRALEQEDQILRLLLDFEVAVANDSEQPAPSNAIAGKQILREQPDDVFERNETLAFFALLFGQADEALDFDRKPDQCLRSLAVGPC